MFLERFSQATRQVLSAAQEEAERFQHATIGSEHLLLSISKAEDTIAQRALIDLGITAERLEADFSDLFPARVGPPAHIDLSLDSKRAIELTVDIVRQQPTNTVEPHHLLLALASMQEGGAYELFVRLDVSPHEVYKHVSAMIASSPPQSTDVSDGGLSKLALNLTRRTPTWNLPPMAGRVHHMQRIRQILVRRYHKKVLLVGHHGVGKSTIVDAITDQVLQADRDETVWRASYEDLVGGAATIAEAEERVQTVISELVNSQHILHIPGMTLSTVNGLDVLIIMRLLMQADIRLIQECSLDFYEEHLEDDSSVQRHFSVLMVGPLPAEDTRTVLIARKAEFEAHHGVEFLDSAIEAILEYADDVMPFLYNPDQALQFMDEVGAIVDSREDLKSPISDETVVSIVNYLTGDSEF